MHIVISSSLGSRYPKVDFLKVAFTQLESCRSQIQILKLLQYKIPYDKDRVFPIFSSLKQLEIAVTDQDYWRLHLLTSFIEASPCLHKLVLHLHHSSFTGQRKIFKRAECSHRYLKVVEMQYLTKTAVNLEEIGVSHFKSWFYHYTDEKPEESERDRAMKDRAMKVLGAPNLELDSILGSFRPFVEHLVCSQRVSPATPRDRTSSSNGSLRLFTWLPRGRATPLTPLWIRHWA
ncbi:hypothetical protein DVH24_023071 [Malus domestica]|uniref:At1g61320/AtMIF1 LRR domain-containing protein n=1 Tax=Malus domestica TaxID=3750 RepID=A0A498KN19_MALDO|nr:hypothetical protein DVH24_023071 [Malus domestica]